MQQMSGVSLDQEIPDNYIWHGSLEEVKNELFSMPVINR